MTMNPYKASLITKIREISKEETSLKNILMSYLCGCCGGVKTDIYNDSSEWVCEPCHKEASQERAEELEFLQLTQN